MKKKYWIWRPKKLLNSAWSDISYFTRGKKFVTVDVKFVTEQKSKQHSSNPYKLAELVLLSTYLGRRTSKVRVGKILPEMEAIWAVTAIKMD